MKPSSTSFGSHEGSNQQHYKDKVAVSRNRTLSAVERERFADLMVRVSSRRDRKAYAELFEFYAPRVKSYILRLGATPTLAEDVAQDVMISVWSKADQFDRGKASVSAWIFRIARNRRIDLYRRLNKPVLDPKEPLILPASLAGPEAQVESLDIERSVRSAMRDLPINQLEILRLSFYDGVTHAEIARLKDVPLGTVKSRVRLALSKLRENLPR